MTIKQAIKILKTHNKWRRGAEIKNYTPAEIGEAIDVLIIHCENENIPKNNQTAITNS
jgi:hypothetical protein